MKEEIKQELERIRPILKRRGVVFTKYMFNSPEILYDARAEIGEDGKTHYQRQYEHNPRRQHQLKKTNNFFISSVGRECIGEELTYLDVGCADGRRTKEFMDNLERFCIIDNYHAVDISPKMIEAAASVLGAENVSVADITDLPYENRFNLISCLFGVIGHLPEEKIQAAFDNLYKAAKPDGLVILDVEAKGEHNKGWGWTQEDERQGRKYFAYVVTDCAGNIILDDQNQPLIGTNRIFSIDELRKYAKNAGFKIREEQEITPDADIDDMFFGAAYALVLQK